MNIDIREKYYKRKKALQDIKLDFPKGQMTLIIGTSGAGKSTLIKCILGQTEFKGKKGGYSAADIAYIPQFTALNRNETVFSAVYWTERLNSFVLPSPIIAQNTEAILKRVGIETIRDCKICNLSGGQKQRVSIAKELIRNKNIIIADEIDTGLDCGTAWCLIKKLKEITVREQKTTIVISHNLMNMQLYDNVVILAKDNSNCGRVVYNGKPNNLAGHFGLKSVVDVLISLIPVNEGGLGKAEEYLKR